MVNEQHMYCIWSKIMGEKLTKSKKLSQVKVHILCYTVWYSPEIGKKKIKEINMCIFDVLKTFSRNNKRVGNRLEMMSACEC